MLRARTKDGLCILGLDAENIRRLTTGQPILVSLSQLGGTDDVMICYGETLEQIQRDLEKATGPFPRPTPLRQDD